MIIKDKCRKSYEKYGKFGTYQLPSTYHFVCPQTKGHDCNLTSMAKTLSKLKLQDLKQLTRMTQNRNMMPTENARLLQLLIQLENQ